jgi:hypothetical protein
MARWQGGLERRERFLGRIVDIGAELFAMTAACVRARRYDGTERAAAVAELADLFCAQATDRAEALFGELWAGGDGRDRRAAERVLAGRYAFLEDGVLFPESDAPWVATYETGPATLPNLRRHVERT